MIDTFDIRVGIQTGNILITLVSYINAMNKLEANEPDEANSEFVMDIGKLYTDMTAEEKRYALVHVAPIWYSRFYCKWLRYTRECEELGKTAPLWMTFRDLSETSEKLLAALVKHFDPIYSYTDAKVQAALDKTLSITDQVRFNKGVGGRGEAYFSDDEKETIYNIMKTAGEEDLRKYGVL